MPRNREGTHIVTRSVASDTPKISRVNSLCKKQFMLTKAQRPLASFQFSIDVFAPNPFKVPCDSIEY
jgi:hypothetical protein